MIMQIALQPLNKLYVREGSRAFEGVWEVDNLAPTQYKDIVLPVKDPHFKDKTVLRPSYL